MQDFIINTGLGDYYIAISPRATWKCPHCKIEWVDWGENAEDEDKPWEAEDRYGEYASAEPDLGWCCPCCAMKRATFATLADFVEDNGLVKEAVNNALTEDGEGAIENGFHEQLWNIFRLGANADFAAHVRDFVEQVYPSEFLDWVQVTA